MNAGTALSAGDALAQGGLITVAGLGTVFLVLILLVLMTLLLGAVIRKLGVGQKHEQKPEAAPAAAASVPTVNHEELTAVIAAAIAETMGTDVTGLRIHSIRKIS